MRFCGNPMWTHPMCNSQLELERRKMHNKKRLVVNNNGSPRLTATGPFQPEKLKRHREKREPFHDTSSPHRKDRSSTESQPKVDSVIDDANQRNARPPCTKHTIRHCYCKPSLAFPKVSSEDWNAHVRPATRKERLKFGEPYDTFRRPLSRKAGGSIFESKDESNRFEIKTPPYFDRRRGFYGYMQNRREQDSWAPCSYGETGWGSKEDGDIGGSEGYEDMEVLPRVDQSYNTDGLVLQWLRGQLIAEREKTAILQKRLRTLEEECVDHYADGETGALCSG
ncbi:hypothetical protein CERZMDRAFT_82225 [Cercospora zeae-maydis SCOH1-5]|uniref:Uncharacterized protein n=1 Tax=Cercospora zeae-maydis SCOH1-5 TaxID=717836 RepID=A0A6A6FNY7_9PEZI|nr:hypothetical protein CERZMDRAFT_82225 [Cercospora zeae-maydis SCOH1-5]